MEFTLNPDRERMALTLVMGLLVNGRTVLEDFAWASGTEEFARALAEFGLVYEQHGHQLVLDGKGFQYSLPSMLPCGFPKPRTCSSGRFRARIPNMFSPSPRNPTRRG